MILCFGHIFLQVSKAYYNTFYFVRDCYEIRKNIPESVKRSTGILPRVRQCASSRPFRFHP